MRTASSRTPTVCTASPSVLSCPPELSHNEILCFPPSLNFGMKMGLESGTLLSHLMNWGFDYAELSGNREVAQGHQVSASGHSFPHRVFSSHPGPGSEAAGSELRHLCVNKLFSTRVPVLPTGSSVGSARAPEKRDPHQQDWRAGGSLAYAVCLGNRSSLAATLGFSVFVPRSQQFTELCLLSFLHLSSLLLR